MNKLLRNKNGFSPVEGVVVILVVAMVGFASYYVYNRSQEDSTQANQTSTTVAEDTSSNSDDTPAVNSTDDLDQAQKFVEGTDVDSGLDTSELDAALLDE